GSTTAHRPSTTTAPGTAASGVERTRRASTTRSVPTIEGAVAMSPALPPSVRLPALLLALASLLSACGNAPEQPSEGPQRQAEPIGGEAETAAADTAEDEPVLPELSEPVDVTAAPAEVFGSWAVDAGACGAGAGA